MLAWLFLLASALAAVDVNTADASTLESLPGIGPSKAEAIVAYRAEHGPFKSLADLDAVNGIGPSTLANLKDLVTFGAGTPTGGMPAGATAIAPAGKAPAAPEGKAAKAEPKGDGGQAGSTGGHAASAGGGCPVNINTADASGLQNLPGIGATKAAAILAYRTDHGAFAACADLDSVSGIGAATLAGIGDCCVVK